MNHREVSGLLPWYANRTLSIEERRAVELHLEDCRECRGDLEQLGGIAEAARDLAAEVPDPSPALLATTMARIERYEAGKARGHTRLSELLGRLVSAIGGAWAPVPVLARVAIVAQFLILAGVVALVLSRPADVPQHGTAGGRPVGTTAKGSRARILVAFQERVPEETLRRTILGFDGEIVAGPSPIGFYTIEVPIEPERKEEITRLLEQLRVRRDVVRFAEAAP